MDRIPGSNLAMSGVLAASNEGARTLHRDIYTEPPSLNGSDGRDSRGRFRVGNPGGPGNPHARQVGVLRSALLAAVTPDDMEQITSKLVELAKAGNVQAIREVYDRTLGRPVEADLAERLEALEAQAAARGRERAR